MVALHEIDQRFGEALGEEEENGEDERNTLPAGSNALDSLLIAIYFDLDRSEREKQ